MRRSGLVKKVISTKKGRRTYWVKPAQPADLSKFVGTTKYYAERAKDFRKREGKAPPAYYMGYGNKYAHRFTHQTRKKLSPEGKKFVDKTLVELQKAIEDRRKRNPAAFARLERNPEKLKTFAYKSHAPAYIRGGIGKLNARDLVRVGMTPDSRDLFTRDGVSQGVAVAKHIASRQFRNLRRGRW